MAKHTWTTSINNNWPLFSVRCFFFKNAQTPAQLLGTGTYFWNVVDRTEGASNGVVHADELKHIWEGKRCDDTCAFPSRSLKCCVTNATCFEEKTLNGVWALPQTWYAVKRGINLVAPPPRPALWSLSSGVAMGFSLTGVSSLNQNTLVSDLRRHLTTSSHLALLSEVWERVRPRRSSWWLWVKSAPCRQVVGSEWSDIPAGSSPEAWAPCPACHPPYGTKKPKQNTGPLSWNVSVLNVCVNYVNLCIRLFRRD